jgi:hypothetical protein
MTSAADGTLGKAVREHLTDNSRRRSVGLSALVVGAVFTAIGIPVNIHYFDSPYTPSGPAVLPGGLLGLGFVGLLIGVLRLVQATRARGEAFFVYEQGLVHRRAGGEAVIRWTDIASVTEGGKDSGPARYLGNDVGCRLRLKQGGSINFTGYTKGADRLASTIASAVQDGELPEPAPRRSRWEG